MPTYEYQCKTCGKTTDVYQSIKARPLTKAECSTCGGVRPVRRLIGTGGAVLFKGSGFYQTDYRSENYKSKAKSETQPKAAASDTKSANPAPSETAAKSAATSASDSGDKKTSTKKD